MVHLYINYVKQLKERAGIFFTAKEGAGMTAAGRAAYNKQTGGNLKSTTTRRW